MLDIQEIWHEVIAELKAERDDEAAAQREIERQRIFKAATPQEAARITNEFLANQEKEARAARSRRTLAQLNAKNAREMTDAEWKTEKRRLGLR